MQQNQQSPQGDEAGALVKFSTAAEDVDTVDVVDFSNSDDDDIEVLDEDDSSERKSHDFDEGGASDDAIGFHARELQSKASPPQFGPATRAREEDSQADDAKDGGEQCEEDEVF